MDADNNITERRPIRVRGSDYAVAVARWLTGTGIQPNTISILSIVFATCASICLVASGFLNPDWEQVMLYILVPPLIIGRLLCNLFDGMVAIEGGKQQKTGGVFNELPDRISDVFVLLAAGYSYHSSENMIWLAWLAAITALGTAYIRLLGATCGTNHYFGGPMAKQHRMHVISAASLVSAVLAGIGCRWPVFSAALGLVAAGSILTIILRLQKVLSFLKES